MQSFENFFWIAGVLLSYSCLIAHARRTISHVTSCGSWTDPACYYPVPLTSLPEAQEHSIWLIGLGFTVLWVVIMAGQMFSAEQLVAMCVLHPV